MEGEADDMSVSTQNPSIPAGGIKLLLIARDFPPMIGGSCVVYDGICSTLGLDGTVLTGIVDHQRDACWDSQQSYQVYRSLSLTQVASPLGRDPFSRLFRGAYVYVWQRLCAAVLTRRIVRQTRPDVVCIGSFVHYWLAALLRKVLHVPVIFYMHGEELTNPDQSRIVGTRNFAALREAEGVIAVSRFTRTKLIELGVSPDRIALIPNGIDLRRFTPGEKDTELLEKYGVLGKTILLTVGRFEERKGHATVLRSLQNIVQSHPEVAYLIVGSSDGLPNHGLEQLARTLGISEHVVFAGRVPAEQLPRFYQASDIFVMPNHTLPNGDTEGFGLVFLEAAACGKPVIGGRDGGVPDAVVDGETGILVDGASVPEVTNAVLRLLRDPELAAGLARNGLRRVQKMGSDVSIQKFRDFCGVICEQYGHR
jgi:phosphatidylinositol alpha-1,6-mannosyltransferase